MDFTSNHIGDVIWPHIIRKMQQERKPFHEIPLLYQKGTMRCKKQ